MLKINIIHYINQGLPIVGILYTSISVVLHDGPTSNVGGDPILLLCYWPDIGFYSVTGMGGWDPVKA